MLVYNPLESIHISIPVLHRKKQDFSVSDSGVERDRFFSGRNLHVPDRPVRITPCRTGRNLLIKSNLYFISIRGILFFPYDSADILFLHKRCSLFLYIEYIEYEDHGEGHAAADVMPACAVKR